LCGLHLISTFVALTLHAGSAKKGYFSTGTVYLLLKI
jgi:hypothetical protein